MEDFTFKEHDEEGLHTLEAIQDARNFNEWMYEEVVPYLSGNILEVGSGIGNISSFFIERKAEITLSDIRENYCSSLRQKFPGKNVLKLDLVHPDFMNVYQAYLGKFDSVFALNVIEHIEDDVLALQHIFQLLRPGGKVLILVPAGPILYNKLDKGLFHFRRYTRSSLRGCISNAGFTIAKTWSFNALGIPAWITGGLLFREKEIKKGQMNAYDKLVPLARLLDQLTFRKIGLSVICVGEKPR
jgi:SAM-dependent methyltransferase